MSQAVKHKQPPHAHAKKAAPPAPKHAPHVAKAPDSTKKKAPHAAHVKGANPAHDKAKPGQQVQGHPTAHAHVPSMLSQGSHGAEVKMLQLLMHKHGIECGPVDGVFGALTQAGVIKFQEKNGLDHDGIVGPKTWGALRDHSSAHSAEKQAGHPHLPVHVKDEHKAKGGDAHPAPKGHAKATGKAHANTKTPDNAHAHGTGKKTGGAHEGAPAKAGHGANAKPESKSKGKLTKDAKLRKEILKVAGSQIGTKENGANGGAALKYQKMFGRGPEPWCADFVSWVFSKAGKKTNSPYCPTFIQKLKREGRWKGMKDPKPGDIVFFDWGHDGKADHVGIVKHANADGSITTIEGNTGKPGGGPEGVWQKKRYRMQIVGFGNV